MQNKGLVGLCWRCETFAIKLQQGAISESYRGPSGGVISGDLGDLKAPVDAFRLAGFKYEIRFAFPIILGELWSVLLRCFRYALPMGRKKRNSEKTRDIRTCYNETTVSSWLISCSLVEDYGS